MINGLDELCTKLGRLSAVSQDMGVKAARRAIKYVQANAKMNCPVNEGELRNSIRTRTYKAEDGATAVCYTNKEYAEYVENGTGPEGAKNHAGISPDIHPVYATRGWAFPASAITSGAYHFAERMYGGEKYYLTSGQRALPFLYPALKDGEKKALDAMEKSAKITIGKEIHD